MEAIYTAEAVQTAAVHNEFNLGYLHTRKHRTVLHFAYIFFLIFFVTQAGIHKVQFLTIAVSAFFWIEAILHNRKSGNIQFKRELTSNNGVPHTHFYQFYEDRIDCHDPNTNADISYQYDKFLSLFETKNLLLLLMNYRLCLVIEKSKVSGGSPDELAEFLLDHCARINPRKVKKDRFGKGLHRILLIVSAICFLLAVLNLAGLPVLDSLRGKLHNSMTYQQMAEELQPLGITVSAQTIEELETYDREYEEEYGEAFYQDNPYASKIIDLLSWEGSGLTDYDTDQWAPSRSGIYWSDMEVMYVDTMYTDLLNGIAAMDEELQFADIHEDYSGVDIDAGTGSVSVSFTLNGEPETLSARYCYDWIDTDILCQIGDLLAEDTLEQDLFLAFDNGQGFFLYYGHPENIGQLNRKTGLDFMILNRYSVLY